MQCHAMKMHCKAIENTTLYRQQLSTVLRTRDASGSSNVSQTRLVEQSASGSSTVNHKHTSLILLFLSNQAYVLIKLMVVCKSCVLKRDNNSLR